MARNTFYFPHDYDARTDEKILGLLAEMGWEGYGLFWGIVETLYQNGGRMQTHYDRIAFALRTDSERIKQVIESYGLFQVKNGDFWSDSILRRLEERQKRSDKARQSAQVRWNDQKRNDDTDVGSSGDANALHPQSDRNAIKEIKEKEIKEKEIKGIPSFEDFKKYSISKKTEVCIEALRLKYESWVENGWKDGKGNKITNWKTKILNTLPYLPDAKKNGSGWDVKEHDQSDFSEYGTVK